MKKKILLLSMLLVMSALSYSATKPSLEASLNSIENKFNDLLEKEAQKKREFEAQKTQLESEVADLRAKEEGKEKVFEKLKKNICETAGITALISPFERFTKAAK